VAFGAYRLNIKLMLRAIAKMMVVLVAPSARRVDVGAIHAWQRIRPGEKAYLDVMVDAPSCLADITAARFCVECPAF
jgi:uncharacterized protein (DUF736 family)